MVELKFGLKTVDLPYSVRLPGVTEEMFQELVDEDMKAELFDGVMTVHSPATIQHDNRGGFLRSLMKCYVEDKGLGMVLGPDALVHLATCRFFAPDLFFIKQRRVTVPMPKEFEGSPDHLTEILSPSNREDDLEDKRPAYQAAAVGEIWLVDPANQEILVDQRRGNRYTHKRVTEGKIGSRIIKGFWIKAEWLWSDPLPKVLPCLLEILKEDR